MNPDWFLVLAVLIGFSFVVWFIQQKINSLLNAKQDTTLIEWAKQTQQDSKSLQQEVSKVLLSTNKDLTATLQQSYGDLHKRLDKAAILIGDLKKEAGQFSELSRSMRDLQGILPIDSKFPMENFKRMVGGETQADRVAAVKEFARDVKKHIDDISKKYILPEEGTMDFALMYVPSEPVFYEIMANLPELSEYSHSKRVLPVSPSTFYAYMRAILMSFEGKKIEERAPTILASLRGIKGDSEKFGEALRVLTKHINDTKNTADIVNSRYNTLASKIEGASGLKGGSGKALEEPEDLPLEETEEIVEER